MEQAKRLKAMENKYSRRATILKRVLECINRKQYREHDKYMIFGGSHNDMLVVPDTDFPDEFSIEQQVSEPEERKPLDELMTVFSELSLDFEKNQGRRLARERTSLTKQQDPTEASRIDKLQTALERLSPQAERLLREIFEKKPKQVIEGVNQEERGTPADVCESLDLHFSDAVLTKLEQIVWRASLFDPVETATIPSESVEKYFEEAHQCFLYGFPTATAMLCRAILDACLTELLDPDKKLKQELERSDARKRPSYLKELIRKAAEKGLLEDAQTKLTKATSPHWAEEIINAGNWATHNRPKFNEKYGGDKGTNQLSELLAITRKALIQLHTKHEG